MTQSTRQVFAAILGLSAGFLQLRPALAQQAWVQCYLPLVGDGIPQALDPDAFWADAEAPLVYGIADDPARGEMLAATDAGVWIWSLSDGSQRRLTPFDGLSSNEVRDLAVDEAGRRWFATLRERDQAGQPSGSGGIDRLNPDDTWAHFGVAEGLPSEDMRSILPAPGGGMVAGGDLGIVFVRPGDQVEVQRHEFGGTWQEINDLAYEGETLWIASSHGVLEYRKDGTWIPRMTTFLHSTMPFGSVSVDPDGSKWLAGSPLHRLTPEGELTRPNILRCSHASNRTGLAVDPKGNRWFGCADRLVRLDSAEQMTEFPFLGDRTGGGGIVHVAKSGEPWFGGRGHISRLNPDGSWFTLEVLGWR